MIMSSEEKSAFEKSLVCGAEDCICGVDEVGRGPLAGPVVCAAVIMPCDRFVEGVDDSKKLSAKKRERLSAEILQIAKDCRICLIEAEKIDEINILEATRLCMKNAVEGLLVKPSYVLTDGNMTLNISYPQRSVIKGDAKCYSIGAASIVAKVYRDRLMEEYDAVYPGYGFARNKGYGTAEHIKAIKTLGLTPLHRRSFLKKIFPEKLS